MLTLAYTLKFLEWWGSEGQGEDMRRAAMALPSPPPPGQVQVSGQHWLASACCCIMLDSVGTQHICCCMQRFRNVSPFVQVHEEGVCISDDPSLCPLCHAPHHTPTVLASSGYVYCYSCIVPHIRRHKQCPVTLLPTQEHQIIRLYTTN